MKISLEDGLARGRSHERKISLLRTSLVKTSRKEGLTKGRPHERKNPLEKELGRDGGRGHNGRTVASLRAWPKDLVYRTWDKKHYDIPRSASRTTELSIKIGETRS